MHGTPPRARKGDAKTKEHQRGPFIKALDRLHALRDEKASQGLKEWMDKAQAELKAREKKVGSSRA